MPMNYRSNGVIAGIASIAMLAGCESTGITDVDLNANNGTDDGYTVPVIDGVSPNTLDVGANGGSGFAGDITEGHEDAPGSPLNTPELGYKDDPFSPHLGIGEQDQPGSPGNSPILGYQEPEPGVGDGPILGYQEPEPGVGDGPILGYQEPEPGVGDGPILGYQEPEPGVGMQDPVEIAYPTNQFPYDFSMSNLIGNDGWGSVAINFDTHRLQLTVGGFEENPDIVYEIQVQYASEHYIAHAGYFTYEASGQVVNAEWELPFETTAYADRIVVIERRAGTPGPEGEDVLETIVSFDHYDPSDGSKGME